MQSVTSNAVARAINSSSSSLENLMAYKLKIAQPSNIMTYVQIKLSDYQKSNGTPLVLCQVYTTTLVFTEGSVAKKINGGNYGLQGISWTGYSADNNDYFWIKINGWRNLYLLSTNKMTKSARTTTAPSGVTFTAPV